MIHPQQDEIRRLVENWAAWTGDAKGAVYAVNPIAWTEAMYASAEERRARTNVIRPIGAEAQLTGEALSAMDKREARALKVYYTSSLTVEMAAAELMHCSKRTFQILVARAHSAFWEAYLALKESAARRADGLRAFAETGRP